MTTTIPASHLDLLEQPNVIVLATIMPDGQPQVNCVRRGYRFLATGASPMSRPILAQNGFRLLTYAYAHEWKGSPEQKTQWDSCSNPYCDLLATAEVKVNRLTGFEVVAEE